jgi:hypothetical protein
MMRGFSGSEKGAEHAANSACSRMGKFVRTIEA